MSLRQYNTLVLNADFRPLSYFPLSVWPWEDAVNAVFKDRVTLVESYDRTVRSPSFEMRIPSVIALKEFQPLDRKPAFTRFNVFLRDDFRCQYCGERFSTQELTFDHVIPRCYGGRTTWENLGVAANILFALVQWVMNMRHRLTVSCDAFPTHLSRACNIPDDPRRSYTMPSAECAA